MEARCTALAVRVAKQKSRQKPKMPSTVQVRALVRKQMSRQKPKIPSTVQVRALERKKNCDPYTWDGTVSDNDDWNWENEVEVRATELGGVESGEGRVGKIEGEKGVNGGQIQNSHLVTDYTQSEMLEITRMFRQMPAEPLFKWLVRLWDTGAKDALQNPFTLGPITEGDPFELEIIVQDDVDDVVMWSLWQRQGKKRVPQDWALVETERITDHRPFTLKTWVPLLGWTREGGVGNKVGRAQDVHPFHLHSPPPLLNLLLIRQGVQIADTAEDIARDIQEVLKDPYRKTPNRDKPRKILVSFHTYALKERILVEALKQKLLAVEGVRFEIRSDLSSVTLNRQWELGRRMEALKDLGATAQLKFPASLRVMANNTMYTFKDWREVDDLIKTLSKAG
ncbi:hypothetical protein NDU88_007290 [Pleurodeles waltl]|uniref:Uncharacterized protein n=1 Tax=Pleurodeles waltl TaxID=8319 RepID=A0AAV7TZD4_PLEWA|nr:hypothetical protein NDU88_007290 [Pleurodeles waltl]